MRSTLLVVDDDPSARDWLAVFAEQLGYEVRSAASGEEAIEAVRERVPDLVTLDVLLPGIDGLATLKELLALAPNLPVVMLSGHGQTQTIVEAVRAGAADFLRKPFDPNELEVAFARALERARHGLHPKRDRAGRLLTRSAKMRAIEEVVAQVADTDITVLVRGESGTGKELVAERIHELSSRAHRPFVKVNCAALPSELLESELFGYEKGAFTGAQRRKLGKFEIASTGTIFLDEIGEIPLGLQAKLLQVLQDGQFARLGGESDVKVDARVVAATNRDLEAAVREGRFREDLFYRLNVVTIALPPLRERPEEILDLANEFIERYAREYNKPRPPKSSRLVSLFLSYWWPGNVRELENLIKRMVVMETEESVIRDLSARAGSRERRPGPIAPTTELERFIKGEVDRVSLKRIARDAAQAAEARLIEKVLQRTRWNRKQAAQILQISYKALLYKMRDAGLAERA